MAAVAIRTNQEVLDFVMNRLKIIGWLLSQQMFPEPSLWKYLPEMPDPFIEPAFTEALPASTGTWPFVGNSLLQEEAPESREKLFLSLQTEEGPIIIYQPACPVLQFSEDEINAVVELARHGIKVRDHTF